MTPPETRGTENMDRTMECVVNILRRSGPGVMPASRLRRELRWRRPPIDLTPDVLQQLSEESEGRLLLLQVALDDSEDEDRLRMLDSWLMLMDAEDAPDYSLLARSLWESLAALAEGIDPGSRVSVCRWVIKAEHARRMCAIESLSPVLP